MAGEQDSALRDPVIQSIAERLGNRRPRPPPPSPSPLSPPPPALLTAERPESLGAPVGVSAAQVVLRWAVQRGYSVETRRDLPRLAEIRRDLPRFATAAILPPSEERSERGASPACRSSRSRRARSDSRRTSTCSAPHAGAAPPPQGSTLLRLLPLSAARIRARARRPRRHRHARPRQALQRPRRLLGGDERLPSDLRLVRRRLGGRQVGRGGGRGPCPPSWGEAAVVGSSSRRSARLSSNTSINDQRGRLQRSH